jgi:small subunit ribosomal protein S13
MLAHELNRMDLDSEVIRKVRENIHRLRRIGSYRGRRHAAGLPVRGQNARENARTARKLNMVDRGEDYHTLVRRPYDSPVEKLE